MIKTLFYIFTIIFFSLIQTGLSQVSSQSSQSESRIKWLSIEEAEKLNRQKPKKWLIDVYTDWCGWCKKMDQSTFTNPEIIKVVNEYFYAVKFNAETSDTIEFNGAKYISTIKGARRTHPLALSLLNWRPSYPTIVYFTERLEYLGAIPGYKTPEQLEVILNYIAFDKFRTISLEEYEKTFKSQIKVKQPNQTGQ